MIADEALDNSAIPMAVPIDEEAAQHLLQGEETHPDALIEEEAAHLTEFEDDDSPPTPRFLQDLGEYRNWRWVPPSIRRMVKTVKTWAKGPQPPQIQVIKPLFPAIQEAPIRLLDIYLPKWEQRLGLLLAFYFCWMLTFGLVFRQGTFASEVEGYGKPADIGCGNTFWGPGNSCGLNGVNCRPFYNSSFAFRCPGECRKRWVLNYRAVGAQEIIYQPLVVGGPPGDEPDGMPIYRGDSFICGAAIHAGIIPNSIGGCGVVSLAGEQRNFDSTDQHGISSIAFDSYFPTSFTFSSASSCEAKDMRWALLAVSLIFTVLLSLFTNSPGVFFWSIYTGIFVHVGFASDPPNYSSVAGLCSNLLGKFLPSAFCAFVVYQYCVTKTLKGLRAQIEKTILWLGGCWFGALSNITLDWIPIQRLTSHDLEQQPGAKLALAIIIILLCCIVVQQVHYFRLEGRLLRYLALYATFIGAILFSLLIPGLSLRIHHYILALLLLPGTSMQTRPVLFYQGLLIGLFINGVARWGFDSILQTPAALQGDAPHYSALPTPLQPLISLGIAASNISFNWDFPPIPYDGFSVLVNDVERFRGYVDEGYGLGRPWVWNREPGLAEPEYFRFGYMQGNINWDYSRAGIWLPDGGWVEMDEGPSMVRSSAALDEAWLDR
jgi:LCCL domain